MMGAMEKPQANPLLKRLQPQASGWKGKKGIARPLRKAFRARNINDETAIDEIHGCVREHGASTHEMLLDAPDARNYHN